MAIWQETQVMRLLQSSWAVAAHSWMACEREEGARGTRGRAATAAVGSCATTHVLLSGVGSGDRSNTARDSSE